MKTDPISEQGVSPIVGVVLMVAVTALLASVVGSFVIESAEEVDANPDAEVIFVERPNGNISVQSTEMNSADKLEVFVDGTKQANLSSVGETVTIPPGDIYVVGVLNSERVVLQKFNPSTGRPPQLAVGFEFSPRIPETRDEVTFDATKSFDSDGNITKYAWDFDDDSTGSGETPTHTYSSDGSYDVSLTVTGEDGQTSTIAETVEVKDPPAVSIEFNETKPSPGDPINFESNSSSDRNITDYEWEFGDGSSSIDANPTHSYSSGGTYVVNLTVTDEFGLKNTTNTSVLVNRPPVVSFDTTPPTNQSTETTIEFNSTSTDTDGSIETYDWEFEDTENATGQNVTHSYSSGGEKTVILTTTDNDGASNKTSQTLNISSTPVAAFNITPPNPETNENVRFDGGNSTDDGSIINYAWAFNDSNNSEATGESIDVVFAEPGDYKITLNVTDNTNVTNSTFKTFTVSGVSFNSDNVTIE